MVNHHHAKITRFFRAAISWTLLTVLSNTLVHATAFTKAEIKGTGALISETVYKNWAFYHQFVDSSSVISYKGSSSMQGRREMISRNVDFAGTDIPLSPQERYVTDDKLVTFPSIIAPLALGYSAAKLPKGIVFTRKFVLRVLAPGTSTATPFWDDPELRAVNPGLDLPHERIIIVINRGASSLAKRIKETLQAIAKSEGIAYTGDILEDGESWAIPDDNMIKIKGTFGDIFAFAIKNPYVLTYSPYGDMVAAGLNAVGIVNQRGKVVYPDANGIGAAADLATIDKDLVIDSIDIDPSSDAWPFSFATYILLPKETKSTNNDCSIPRTLVKFFIWTQTNELAVQSANSLGSTLPFRFLRKALQVLEMNITCNNELASEGLGHVVIAGAALVTSPFAKLGPIYEAVEPKHPTLFSAVGSPRAISLLKNEDADMITIESPLDDATLEKLNLIQLPIAAGPIVIAYNIPSLPSNVQLTLSLDALVGLFEGSITALNDMIVARNNQDIYELLPSDPVNIIVRSDDAGSTQPFTKALKLHSPGFKPGASATPDWPASFKLRGKLPQGVANLIKNTPNSIGYLPLDTALENDLSIASLVNPSGRVVRPDLASIVAASRMFLEDKVAQNIENARGESIVSLSPDPEAWPLMATAYLVTRKIVPPSLRCDPYSWSASYFAWVLTDPNARATLESVYFAPLPIEYAQRMLEHLASIRCDNEPPEISPVSSSCAVTNGLVCGGPKRGNCQLINEASDSTSPSSTNTVLNSGSDASTIDGRVKCFCLKGWQGSDCMTPVPAKASSLRRDLGTGLGTSGAAVCLALIALYIVWQRLSRPPVWLVSRHDFSLDSFIARGGHAVVFLGTWKATKVAIKVVRIRWRRGEDEKSLINLQNILLEGDGVLDKIDLASGMATSDTILSGSNNNTNTNKKSSSSLNISSGPAGSSDDLVHGKTRKSTAEGKHSVPVTGDSKIQVPMLKAVNPAAKPATSGNKHSNFTGPEDQTRLPGSLNSTSDLAVSDSQRLISEPKRVPSWSREKSGLSTRFSTASMRSGNMGSSAIKRNSKTTSSKSTRASGIVLNEVNFISKLRHPNVAFMIAASFFNDHLFMLLEYMDAGSLYDALRNQMLDLSPSVRIRIILDACRGLLFLHNQSPPVMHMDLKSPNILLDSHFTAKITDFGLSSVKSKVATEGTIPWTAPEVLRGEKYTCASDIYSMGLVLWEVAQLDGKAPWAGTSPEEIRENVLAGKRPALSDDQCPLGPMYAQLIRQCWSQNPDDRPDVEIIVEELEHILSEAEKLDSARAKDGRMRLLHMDLPSSMREEIMRGVEVTPVPFQCVTLIFTDIVGFTKFSSDKSAEEVSDMLAALHDGCFDKLVVEYGAHHLETIGDAYIVACNFPRSQENHASAAAQLGLAMARACKPFGIQIRVGIHTGPAVATIVGKLHPKLTLLGDTVNAASRMEHVSPPGMVTISHATYEMIKRDRRFKFAGGKAEEIKGKGMMRTYRVLDYSADALTDPAQPLNSERSNIERMLSSNLHPTVSMESVSRLESVSSIHQLNSLSRAPEASLLLLSRKSNATEIANHEVDPANSAKVIESLVPPSTA